MLYYEMTDSLIIKLELRSPWICSSILAQFLVKISVYMKERNYNICMGLAQILVKLNTYMKEKNYNTCIDFSLKKDAVLKFPTW